MRFWDIVCYMPVYALVEHPVVQVIISRQVKTIVKDMQDLGPVLWPLDKIYGNHYIDVGEKHCERNQSLH